MLQKRNYFYFSIFVAIIVSLIFSILTFDYSNYKPPPVIQVRDYNEPYKTFGKVTFQNTGYKGVFRVKLNDDIPSQLVSDIAKEFTEKYNCSLVIPSHPEVDNPDIINKWFFIQDATDDSVIEIGKDERIKFISQYYPDH